jgi:hypothetical protein
MNVPSQLGRNDLTIMRNESAIVSRKSPKSGHTAFAFGIILYLLRKVGSFF